MACFSNGITIDELDADTPDAETASAASAITTRAKIFLTFLTSVSLTALDARCAMAAPKGGHPLSLGSVLLAPGGPAACELGAGAHSEFGVHTRERSFHRSRCDVECCGHFTVCPTFGDELGDTSLRCRQLPARRRPAADPPELGAGALGPQRRAQLLEEAKRSLERIPRGAALTRLPLHDAKGEERARRLERKRQLLELVERAIAFGLRLVGRARSRSDQPTAARTDERPRRCACCSKRARCVAAASSSPSLTSASTSSVTKRIDPGSPMSAPSTRATSGPSCSCASAGLSSESSSRPSAHRLVVVANIVPSSARANASLASERAARSRPRPDATSARVERAKARPISWPAASATSALSSAARSASCQRPVRNSARLR